MSQPAKSTGGFTSALASGSVAGLCVDLTFFPLDTVKTRLQSAQGFWATGGFRGIYAGLGSVAVGSVPGAALFFCTYESIKKLLAPKFGDRARFLAPLVAASCGEVVGCLVRVPCEVVKQRAQASHSLSSRAIFSSTLTQEGIRGLYRGYMSTVMREVPFSFVQFPLWEALKSHWSEVQGHSVQPWQSSVCGALAGGTAAFLTTPLDVAKTRIMLAEAGTELARGNLTHALKEVYQTKGIFGLFAGTSARVLWISAGGAVFLGVYDQSQALIAQWWHPS